MCNTTIVNRLRTKQFDVYIGRDKTFKHNYQTFGNPFTHTRRTNAIIIVANRDEAIRMFKEWILGTNWVTLRPEQRKWILDNLHTLKDKTLACWCKPLDCHGDILIELLNKKNAEQSSNNIPL